MIEAGAFFFGLVVGWITYRTLRRKEGGGAISDIAAVIAAVGGGAVAANYKPETEVFGYYSVGLAVGFFLYFIVGLIMEGKASAGGWMMDGR